MISKHSGCQWYNLTLKAISNELIVLCMYELQAVGTCNIISINSLRKWTIYMYLYVAIQCTSLTISIHQLMYWYYCWLPMANKHIVQYHCLLAFASTDWMFMFIAQARFRDSKNWLRPIIVQGPFYSHSLTLPLL